jgi:glycosyltransferase involved in cell wall biosynthesis
MNILSIIGQKPEMTGSGVLLKELWKCGEEFGDEQRVVVAAYTEDDYSNLFDGRYEAVTYTRPGASVKGELPFPILGMSDVMPYTSLRYSQARRPQIDAHIKAFLARVDKIMTSFNPGVIHLHHLWVLTSIARFVKGIPFFVTVHGTDLKQASVAPQHLDYVYEGIAHVDCFLCVSRDIMNDAKAIYNLSPEKTVLMGNGYNKSIFHPSGTPAECEGRVVVAAGKYVSWKGYHYLIRACRGLSALDRLVILGGGTEEARQTLVREAAANGIQDKLILTGHVPQTEVAKWFRRADVFVLPSIYEPFGLVLLEAMACGCPVIASAIGGSKDIIASDLVGDGLATFVPPLKEGDVFDEERYVNDFRMAIEKHLSKVVSPLDRKKISESVKGHEWKDVYRSIHAEYVKADSALTY